MSASIFRSLMHRPSAASMFHPRLMGSLTPQHQLPKNAEDKLLKNNGLVTEDNLGTNIKNRFLPIQMFYRRLMGSLSRHAVPNDLLTKRVSHVPKGYLATNAKFVTTFTLEGFKAFEIENIVATMKPHYNSDEANKALRTHLISPEGRPGRLAFFDCNIENVLRGFEEPDVVSLSRSLPRVQAYDDLEDPDVEVKHISGHKTEMVKKTETVVLKDPPTIAKIVLTFNFDDLSGCEIRSVLSLMQQHLNAARANEAVLKYLTSSGMVPAVGRGVGISCRIEAAFKGFEVSELQTLLPLTRKYTTTATDDAYDVLADQNVQSNLKIEASFYAKEMGGETQVLGGLFRVYNEATPDRIEVFPSTTLDGLEDSEFQTPGPSLLPN